MERFAASSKKLCQTLDHRPKASAAREANSGKAYDHDSGDQHQRSSFLHPTAEEPHGEKQDKPPQCRWLSHNGWCRASPTNKWLTKSPLGLSKWDDRLTLRTSWPHAVRIILLPDEFLVEPDMSSGATDLK